MINHGVQIGSVQPPEIEITDTSVFMASNVQPYQADIDGHIVNGYRYDYIEYTKDEYIAKLHQDVLDTQLALCDIYETLLGDE